MVPRHAVYELPDNVSLEIAGKLIVGQLILSLLICKSIGRANRRRMACYQYQSF